MQVRPVILKKRGRNEFVVLTYEEFLRLQERLEDAEDVLALRRAREGDADKPTISLEEMKRKLGMRPEGKTRGKSSRRRRIGRST